MTRFALLLCMTAVPAMADDADIVGAEARANGDSWQFSVTLEHGDTGWDDYADGWRVVGPDGTEFGFRELLHPHVNEQPFTRSLSGVSIPGDIDEVYIEARTNTDGWGTAQRPVALTR